MTTEELSNVSDLVTALLKDPRKADEEMREFRETARCLSSNRPRLIELYANEWIALYGGQVRAHGPELPHVLAEMDAAGFSREQTIVRFLHRNPRTLIL